MISSQASLLPRRILCATLALLAAFFAVALFSPLHVHRNHQCSLNNLEYQITDSVAPVLVLPPPQAVAVAIVDPQTPALRSIDPAAALSRGPPSHS